MTINKLIFGQNDTHGIYKTEIGILYYYIIIILKIINRNTIIIRLINVPVMVIFSLHFSLSIGIFPYHLLA